MKKTAFLLTLLALFLFRGAGFSQNSKDQERAAQQVEALNKQLIEGDSTAALADAQKAKLQDIYLKKMMKMKEIDKSSAGEAEKKEQKKVLNQETSQEINKNVLTAEQKQARKKARESKKE